MSVEYICGCAQANSEKRRAGDPRGRVDEDEAQRTDRKVRYGRTVNPIKSQWVACEQHKGKKWGHWGLVSHTFKTRYGPIISARGKSSRILD